jgi:hypothetical protein
MQAGHMRSHCTQGRQYFRLRRAAGMKHHHARRYHPTVSQGMGGGSNGIIRHRQQNQCAGGTSASWLQARPAPIKPTAVCAEAMLRARQSCTRYWPLTGPAAPAYVPAFRLR